MYTAQLLDWIREKNETEETNKEHIKATSPCLEYKDMSALSIFCVPINNAYDQKSNTTQL